MSWAGGRSKVTDDRYGRCAYVLLLDVPYEIKRESDSRRKCAGCLIHNGGTLEHPEELTDRCCLSALAGLSKYLPLLGAGGIIAFWSDMSTLGFAALRTL